MVNWAYKVTHISQLILYQVNYIYIYTSYHKKYHQNLAKKHAHTFIIIIYVYIFEIFIRIYTRKTLEFFICSIFRLILSVLRAYKHVE